MRPSSGGGDLLTREMRGQPGQAGIRSSRPRSGRGPGLRFLDDHRIAFGKGAMPALRLVRAGAGSCLQFLCSAAGIILKFTFHRHPPVLRGTTQLIEARQSAGLKQDQESVENFLPDTKKVKFSSRLTLTLRRLPESDPAACRVVPAAPDSPSKKGECRCADRS